MKKSKNSKSIQKKLLKNSIGITGIFLLLLGTISSVMNYQSSVSSLEQTMTETVQIAADSITYYMDTYRALANEIAHNSVLSSPYTAHSVRAPECEALAERNGFVDIDVTDAEGKSRLSTYSIADREYFIKAKESGETYISDPIYRDDIDEMNIIIATPIIENNKFQGVVYMGLNADFLCDIVAGIDIGETGNASLINANGDTIGYEDIQLVKDAYNTQAEAKNDKKLEKLAAVEREVISGKTGFDSYSYGGVSKYVAYAPVPNTNGWGLYIAVARSEFLSGTYLGIAVVIIVLIAAIALSSLLMRRLASSIVKPIVLCVQRMQSLAEGDLTSEVPHITTGDETQILADSARLLIDNLQAVIGDIDYCLSAMSDGNFAVSSRAEEHYVGDFENIIRFIKTLNVTLNDTLHKITDVAVQVALGSEHMAQSAQTLAEGASEQAGAVEELTATVTNVASMAEDNAVMTDRAAEDANSSAAVARSSSGDIEALTAAMASITNTSLEIEKIIATIEDIASQTNLLSLNASIEAARAGEAGRGFAVVADQIGKLASDSARSAVMTRDLISKSLEEINRGNDITEKTAAALKDVIERMRGFSEIASETNKTSKSQADAVVEVQHGIEQIAGVVQDNSAAAEETSATSQELSAQSAELKALVGRFQLK